MEALAILEPVLQMFVMHQMWVMGTELWPSMGAVSDTNHLPLLPVERWFLNKDYRLP